MGSQKNDNNINEIYCGSVTPGFENAFESITDDGSATIFELDKGSTNHHVIDSKLSMTVATCNEEKQEIIEKHGKTNASFDKGGIITGDLFYSGCKELLQDIKKKKIRYATFWIEDEREIVQENIGKRDSSFQDFLNDITFAGENECRYGLYDVEYNHQLQGTIDLNKK